MLKSVVTLGQTDTIFLTSDYRFTKNPDEVTYLRVIESKNSDETTKVIDLLKTGEKYFDGSVVYLNSDLQVNDYSYFYDNGKIKYEGKIDNITEKGFKGFIERTYYFNGQLRCEQTIMNGEERFLKAFDPDGNSTIVNGHGTATIEIFYYNLIWAGKIRDNKRDSTWIATDTQTGKIVHTEDYRLGKFLSGKTWTENGIIPYKEISSTIPSKLISNIRKDVKREIGQQIDKTKTQKKYKVGLFFRNGRITEIRHLINDIKEQQINFERISIPTEFEFLERGLPIERMTLGVKI